MDLKIDWMARTGLTWPGVGPRGWGGDFSNGKYEEVTVVKLVMKETERQI